ncbi:PREDICTED: uncharacterized protein LOC108755666 [Trachymyrmex septentrionalis]|uniref:uncharacterized protein LOC108755666 n=1 Tax=Trachymyrmex septentrionalis TaxID=34720 RepID=UPI00084F2766|nr:PREDICTED: uncharacterized protein LOC108755666 [Trachymyrmex septentrionalis]
MDSDNESLNLVQTCGLCEMICEQAEIGKHACLKGYTQYITEPDTLYFYPLLDDGVTVIKSRVSSIDKKQIITVQLPKKNTDFVMPIHLSEPNSCEKRRNSDEGLKTKLSHDDEETLILEVQLREPLWNYKLPLSQRNLKITKKLWQEVANALNGKITVNEVKTKFKSLHDTYRRIIRLETSASARKNGKKWLHYDSMEFLRDSCLLKTTSNIEIDDFEDVENESNSGPRNKRKKSNFEKSASAIDKIANALCDNNDVPVNLPPIPVPDEIDAFLSMLGCQLRELGLRKRRKIMKKFLDIIYDALAEHT